MAAGQQVDALRDVSRICGDSHTLGRVSGSREQLAYSQQLLHMNIAQTGTQTIHNAQMTARTTYATKLGERKRPQRAHTFPLATTVPGAAVIVEGEARSDH